jgi:phosphohistidine swiveling domain-containing protein
MIDTQGFNPITGEWNDSLRVDFIWDNTNIGEALSMVVTPFTWSLVGGLYEQMDILPGLHSAGNIGGRPYQNASAMYQMLKAMGKDPLAMARELGSGGELPEGFTIPIPKLTPFAKLAILRNVARMGMRMNTAWQNLPKFVMQNPVWCRETQRGIEAAHTSEELLPWSELLTHTAQAFWIVVSATWRYGDNVVRLRQELVSLVGHADANALLSNVSQKGLQLASLGPVLGLSQVARGEMDRQTYIDRYGHRGPYEAECSIPRPAEDPAWLDRQLAAFREQSIDVAGMLAAQQAKFDEAWQRFSTHFPKISARFRQRLNQAAEVIRNREDARSELTRLAWIGRIWALKAGDLTGLGADIFHFTIAETLALLAGKEVPIACLPARKETYTRYRALPPYPSLISGQFEPFTWAADPNRRSDYYDSHAPMISSRRKASQSNVVAGTPGSGGCVEGLVRRLDSPAEEGQLQQGEILVTSQTDIGWTLLFPRLAAVVTDVGAPLSHAAIVARELGIPAVVGCGDATARLQTGDRVRVDGGRGVVEIIEHGNHQP